MFDDGKPDSLESVASLGLKIQFPSGQEAITVPTHAFVALRSMDSPYKLRIIDLFGKVKKKLARFAPVSGEHLSQRLGQHSVDLPVIRPWEKKSSLPVTRKVTLLSFMNYMIFTCYMCER